MMHFFRLCCAMIVLVIFLLALVLAEKAGAAEWCEGYILTGEPASFDGYMVGVKSDGSDFVYRETSQGYQLFAGEGPNTVDPRLCIEIEYIKEEGDE
ncbi:hypothetical protein [Alcanivorax jadensis]|uniref:hypothetical protein n=1 Tax=Alcanivorax jadensis TaxID=64988 RepID=UPI002356BEB1|nr:hypothetical protein [Alcanivorax jadensis]|tara:strand:- start:2169 stop:2459 length:291 start_codon:yes stop_codon:yes gene_type:complete